MKYIVGQAIHMLLENSLRGKPIESTRSTAKIIENYKKSPNFKKWLKFFSKYSDTNWELYIEKRIQNIVPDVMLLNHKKVLVVEIKTGEKRRRKLLKVLVQLYKYYQVLKEVYPKHKIYMYVFWAKYGEFELFNDLLAELHSLVSKQSVGGLNHGKAKKSTESTLMSRV